MGGQWVDFVRGESFVRSALEGIVDELREADRQERIELLIDLAKGLPPLPERLAQFKDEAHRVPECQSPVFLFAEVEAGRVRLFADVPVEAPTVRGFVALLVEGLQGATVEEILQTPYGLIEQSGMPEILGMQRISGLHGVIRGLKALVSRAAMAQASSPSPN
jgi:cysteine desulfuration protein SufE